MHRFSNKGILVVALVVAITATGTAGYYFIEEGWSVLDALYMTAITISTVGFGETHALTPEGRIFTVFLLLLGLSSAAFIATNFAQFLIETQLRMFDMGKTTTRKIAGMNGHFIVCGIGRIGSTICKELSDHNLPFVAIDDDEGLVAQARKSGHISLKGNALSEDILNDAGIKRAAGVVAALSSDADNLYISLAAREMNPTVFVISRGEEPGSESRILRAGADIVVSPMTLGGQQIFSLL
jgi:voltage-gated potassium channel